MLPDWPDTHALFTTGPVPARLVAGLAGVVLLLAGTRAWRAAVALPGLLLGLGVALLVGTALALEPGPLAVLAAVLGLGGTLAALLVERLAVRVAGVLAGLGAAQVGWPLIASALSPGPGAPGHAPWWIWPAAALVGGLLAPLAWRVALAPITAWIGAVVLVDATGAPPHPLLVAGLAAVGTLVQWASGRKPRDDEER